MSSRGEEVRRELGDGGAGVRFHRNDPIAEETALDGGRAGGSRAGFGPASPRPCWARVAAAQRPERRPMAWQFLCRQANKRAAGEARSELRALILWLKEPGLGRVSSACGQAGSGGVLGSGSRRCAPAQVSSTLGCL